MNIFYNLCFPLVETNVKKKCRKPWITLSLKKSINRKHKLYCIYIKNPNEANKKRYVDYRNILTNTVRLSKKRYYDNLFQCIRKDTKKTWSHINELLGRGKKRLFPAEMYHDEVLLISNLQKAEYFNKYFVNLPSKISMDIPNVQSSFHRYLPNRNHHTSLFFWPTSVCEILNVVSSLKPSNSSGSDDIAPRIIKECIHIIVEPLCDIFKK